MSEKMTAVTEKMNNLNRRTIAIILAVALVLSVFAGTGWFAVSKADETNVTVNSKTTMDAIINNYDNIADNFDYCKYAGDLLSSGVRKNIIEKICKYETPSSSLASDLRSNNDYQAAYLVWRGLESTEDIKNHYTTVIIKSIADYYSKDTFISVINNSSISHVIKFKKYANSLVSASSEYSILKDIISSKPNISDWTEDEKNAISKSVDEYIKQQKLTYVGPIINSKSFERAEKLLGYCKTYDQFAAKVGAYVALEKVQDETIEFLEEVRQNAVFGRRDYLEFVESLDLVIEIAKGNEEVFFNKINKDAYSLFGKPLIQKALKNLFVQSVSAFLSGGATIVISTVLDVAKIATSITKGLGNIAFSVDAKLDSYQIMCCLRDYEDAMQKALYKDVCNINQLKEDSYATNIKKVLAGTELLFKVLDYDCDIYLKLIDTCLKDKVTLGASNSDLGEAKNQINLLKQMIAEDYQTWIIPGGSCDSTAWVITDDGVLIIYGYGEMNGYGAGAAPWYKQKDLIHNISVSSAIDWIGSYAFYGLNSLDRNIVFIKPYKYNEGCFNEIPNRTNLLFAETPHFWRNHEIKANIYSKEGIADDDYGNVGLSGSVFLTENVSFISCWRGIIVRNGGRFSCQDMTNADGTFIVDPGGYVEVRGDLTGGSGIRVNGTMIIRGNCLKRGIDMTTSGARLEIFGDYGGHNVDVWTGTINNGTAILHGNVYGKFYTSGDNLTILNGTEKQEVASFSVANLRLENTSSEGVKFTTWATVTGSLFSSTKNMTNGRLLRLCGTIVGNEYYGDFRLDNGATIDHDLVVHGSVYGFPNGFDRGNVCEPGVVLTVEKNLDLTANGTYGGNESTLLIPNGATVNVRGDALLSGNYYPGSNWMVQRVTLQIDGELNVDGNFLTGTNGFASLKMVSPSSKLFIGGKYRGYQIVEKNIIAAGEPSQVTSDIQAGTLEVRGDIEKLVVKGTTSVYSCGTKISNSAFTGDTVVVLNSNEKQIVADCAFFSTVVLLHNNGLIVQGKVSVSNLFNHNGKTFEIQDTVNSTFVDFDNDGLLDNEDPYPTDPNNEKHYTETKHQYELVGKIAATCTEGGLEKYRCSICGATREKAVPALGHNFTWASNMHIAPTCTAKGYTVQTCSRCGETQQVNELPTTGHDYGDVLGASHIATIYDANHRFKDSLAYTPNTVTANTVGSTPIESDSLFEAAWMTLPREIRLGMNDLSAMEGYYLSRQRQPLFFHSMETTIPAAFAYDASAGRAPEESALPYTDGKGNLYVVDGETITVSLSKEEALAKGILNDDGTVNVKTAIAEGYDLAYSAGLPGTYIILPDLEFESMLSGWNTPVSIFHYDGKGTASPGIYTVNYCFYNEKRSGLAGTTIKVYDTDALNYKTPATTDTPAQLHHRCIDCGEEIVEDITNNGELKIRASSLSLGNNLIMNFKVSQNTLEGFDDPYVEVLRNGKTTRITSFKEQGNDYVFSFENIAPQTMNDELSATLYATKDGALYGSSTLKTSVKSYAKFLLETYSSDKYAKLRTLVVDLLNYGAEAQKYRDYKTNDLVNAELTSEQRSWASGGDLSLSDITDSSYQTVETPVASWSSVALILDNSVTVRYKFTANDIDGMSIKVKYGDTGKEFDSSCFESLGEGTYSFKFSELSAHQMQVPLYATIYKDGEAVSNTFAYNVESYAARVKQTQPNTALGKLTDALMRYGFSATKYKNS